MPHTVIKNHEPSDKGWGVVIGRLAPPRDEREDSPQTESADVPPSEEDD